MSYINVENILPKELVEEIQKYVDGAYLYIPKAEENRRAWGDSTETKKQLAIRNASIFEDFKMNIKVKQLAEKYYLSEKSIQRIILQEKRRRKLVS